MNSKRQINRANAIAKAIEEAKKFYSEYGFMDFTRFCGFFKKIRFKNNDERIGFLVNCYCLVFSKEEI